MPPQTTPVPPKQVGQPFDRHLVAMFEPVVDEAFKQHGDTLRTVIVLFDYHGALNAADVAHAIWRAYSGPAATAADITGSIGAGMAFMEMAMNRLYRLSLQAKEELDETNRQLEEARQALEAAKEELGPDQLRGERG